MRVAVASTDVDGDLALEIIEAPTAFEALMKHVEGTLGFDNLPLEDDAGPDDVIAAMSDEGRSLDYQIVT